MSLMKIVKYDLAFMFAYSSRDKTHAHRKLNDNVNEKDK
jgi:tRNA A37 methylthiotransferase MiaB